MLIIVWYQTNSYCVALYCLLYVFCFKNEDTQTPGNLKFIIKEESSVDYIDINLEMAEEEIKQVSERTSI